MYHTVTKQQNLLTKAFIKIYLVCSIIVLLISLTNYNTIRESINSPQSLLYIFFPRYFIFSGLYPTFLLILVATIKIRLQDILISQTRNIIIFQVLYRIFITILLMVTIWSIGTITIISICGYFYLFEEIWFTILIRIIYLWIALFLLGLIEVTIYFITKNKVFSFFVSFGIIGLSFYLVISKKTSLFFDFTTLDSNLILFSKTILLLGTIFLIIPLMIYILRMRDL